MTYARRKDASHNLIADALRAAGILVLDGSRAGSGFPDLLCYDPSADRWLPIECKSDRRISHYSKGHELTPGQLALRASLPIPIAETPAQALALFGR